MKQKNIKLIRIFLVILLFFTLGGFPCNNAIGACDDELNKDEVSHSRSADKNDEIKKVDNHRSWFFNRDQDRDYGAPQKPVIYLYPQKEIEVFLQVGKPENLMHTYPFYKGGWRVMAKPNGDLKDLKTGRSLYALYWEGKQNHYRDIEDGFIVKGEEVIPFLEEKLAILGLNEREANEFIIYWLPKLESNKYNLIRFKTIEEQDKDMPLQVNPKPDTVIRVMMEYKILDNVPQIKEQILPSAPERKGFTLVEWGGTELDDCDKLQKLEESRAWFLNRDGYKHASSVNQKDPFVEGWNMNARKPIIYLYPKKEIEVFLQVGKPENLTHTYPVYKNGWRVMAKLNGDLKDLKTGRSLYALYWEGKQNHYRDVEDGFIVKGKEVIPFLEEKLAILGLNEREANEFIIYWLPKLEFNEYNLIRFKTIEEQDEDMPLQVNPKPDTVIRVMMEYKILDNVPQIKEQILPSTPERKGFTLVEWGGIKLDDSVE